MKQNVVIVMRNPWAALGLKQLLLEHFDVQALVAEKGDDLPAITQSAHLLLTDEHTYVTRQNLFLPRQSCTVVFASAVPAQHDTGVMMVDTSQDTAHIVARLQRLFAHQMSQAAPSSLLSQREIDVLRLVVSGCINKEIASRLNISINTVLTHRKNITAKLGIKSVSGLTFYAMMNGIIAPR